MSQPPSPDELFRLHSKIRWAAFSTDGNVIFSQMRPGLSSYTSDAEDRAFMEFGPIILSGVAERLTESGGAGRLRSIVVNFDKDSVLLMRFRNGYLALSADPPYAYGVFQEIDAKLQQLNQ
jgi:hypothetical protein